MSRPSPGPFLSWQPHMGRVPRCYPRVAPLVGARARCQGNRSPWWRRWLLRAWLLGDRGGGGSARRRRLSNNCCCHVNASVNKTKKSYRLKMHFNLHEWFYSTRIVSAYTSLYYMGQGKYIILTKQLAREKTTMILLRWWLALEQDIFD